MRGILPRVDCVCVTVDVNVDVDVDGVGSLTLLHDVAVLESAIWFSFTYWELIDE